MFGIKKNKNKYDKVIKTAEKNLVATRGFSDSMIAESGRYINFANMLLATKR